MKRSFKLEIVSPEARIFSKQVTKLFAKTLYGELEILYGHAPLLAQLVPGLIWFATDTAEENGCLVHGGLLEVQNSQVIILAELAVQAQELNASELAKNKAELKSALDNKTKKINYTEAYNQLNILNEEIKLLKKLAIYKDKN